MDGEGLERATSALRQGSFVLIHDSVGRENEVDMVIAAEHVKPSHVAKMRRDAGGLLCVALDPGLAKRLGLPYITEALSSAGRDFPVLLKLVENKMPYGDPPAFSITVSHRSARTGITDEERAATIRELARVCKAARASGEGFVEEFVSNFRSPGHVHILIASDGLLGTRKGHTELAVYLAHLAGLTPVVAVCEMLDPRSYKALSLEGARIYARKNGVPLITSDKLIEAYITGIKVA